ncbi:MAG: hypothetical protein HY875_08205 [Chloroflexi bacterium]|nr:hypothetical protein [Chloroflexota bacterium]
MVSVTITLPDDLHRALKSRSETCGKTIEELIVEQLAEEAAAAAAARKTGLEILEKARRNASVTMAGMTEDEIMELAVAETHAVRREMAGERRAAAGRK